MIIDDRAEETRLNAAVVEIEPTARAEPRLAQDYPGGDAGHRAFVVQHGHRADDGVHELLLQGPPAAQGGDGAVRAVALALRPAPGRGALAAVGPRPHAGLRALAQFDEALLKEDTIEVPVQINGKLRGRIMVAAGADRPAMEAAARADEKIAELLAGKTIVKTIIVPGKMVNFVVKG